MTTSTFAPAPSMIFPSTYGQPGFYGQFGYEHPALSPVGYGIPQIYGWQQLSAPQIPGQQFGGQQFGGQQFGGQQFPGQQLGGQQFGGQPQLGISDQLGFAVQVLPQLLWAAQQNLSIALHLVQQVVQQAVQPYGRQGFGEAPWARQFARPYSMTW